MILKRSVSFKEIGELQNKAVARAMEKYELTLCRDNSILDRIRNQNLVIRPVGVFIELRLHHVLQDTPHAPISITQNSVDYFYKQAGDLLSFEGMLIFLANILHQAQVPVSSQGFLSRFKLGRPDLYSTPVAIHNMISLAQLARWYLESIRPSGFVSQLPLAIDLRVITIRHQEFRRPHFIHLEESLILDGTNSDVGGDGSGRSGIIHKVAKLKEVRIGEEESDCSICLETLRRGQVAAQLPYSHMFHRKCICHWMKERYSCPLCRAPMDVDSSS